MHNSTYPGTNLNSSCQCQNEAMLQTLLQRRARRANHRCTHQLGFKVGLFCNNDVCELRGLRSGLTEVERERERKRERDEEIEAPPPGSTESIIEGRCFHLTLFAFPPCIQITEYCTT